KEAIDRSHDALERTDRAGYEARFVAGDGRIVWLRCAARAVRDPTGKLVAIRGVAVDVTERRNAEERLRLLERATESIEQGILVAAIPNAESPPHQIQLVNRAFEQITGWTRDEVLGRDPGFLRGPLTEPAARAAIVGAIREQRTYTGEILNYRKDGRPFWNSLTLSPITAPSGRASHYVGIVTDVTEQKRAAEQLRQAMKMEAVGRLAGGVAHDFNNILTAIIGYADLLASAPDLSERARRAAREIRDAGDRAADLTRQLLAFSRKQVLEPRVVSLVEHVQAMQGMLRRLIREDVDFCLVLQPGLSSIKVDPSQLEQVIVNLVVNARDAMPDGGKLTIETADVDLDATYAAAHPGVQTGPHVLFAVSDTGTGMSPEVLSHIFEPFFTTKPVGQGTGLGLATVYGIVRQSGGHVWAYSETGQGTTIKVYFPRAAGTPESVSRSVASPAQGGSETLLVVEDEDAVRTLACEVLAHAGYTVLEASSGAAGLAICEQHLGPIALMLADVVMPKMNGRELAERAVKQRPGLRVVFMSGYTDNAIVHHGVLDAGVEFLGKPFTPAALLRRVRDVLDRVS
ncbi:MAG: PAS domain S-box protein, partial [Planctomycetes bacterium]|nr:PAS domain S-box protein [Planctomycetota bacterium]